jgi:GT2 family glycosyltransferase
MNKESPYLQHITSAAVCSVHVEQLEHGLANLQGYRHALVVFRLRDAVVGQAWLPVNDGCITPAKLRESLPAMAWPIWRQLVAQDPDPAPPAPTASVVVCTRDRTDDLAQCLPGLLRLAEQGHEVIVVDNCPSNDSTAQLVAGYPAIRYLREPRPGLDVARNRGLLAATAEIVAFTDDDAQVDPGWLSALRRNFDDPLVAVVTGVTMPLELATEAQCWFERTNGFGRGFVRKQFDVTNVNILGAGQVGAGVNMAIRRSAVEEIGFFDEALDGGTLSRSGGDQEFFYRALARGYRIVYEPAALVWHRHRREWDVLRNTIYGYGVGVFAWWTRALLVEKELTLLKGALNWFPEFHVRNLVRSLLRRPGCMPLDLALAEFRGALAGPISYLRARRRLQQQIHAIEHATEVSQVSSPASGRRPALPLDQAPASAAGQGLEIP